MKFYNYNTETPEELSELIRQQEYLVLSGTRADAELLLKAMEDVLELEENIYLDSKDINGKMYYFITYEDFDRNKVIEQIRQYEASK